MHPIFPCISMDMNTPDSGSSVSFAPRRSSAKALSSMLIIGMLVLVFLTDAKRRAAESQVAKLSMKLEEVAKAGNQQEGAKVAQEVIGKLRTHIMLPASVEPTVATIVDVEALKEQNSFYAPAKNGDHLIVTADRAILFDAERNIILDVVPVQLQAPGQGAAERQTTQGAR